MKTDENLNKIPQKDTVPEEGYRGGGDVIAKDTSQDPSTSKPNDSAQDATSIRTPTDTD